MHIKRQSKWYLRTVPSNISESSNKSEASIEAHKKTIKVIPQNNTWKSDGPSKIQWVISLAGTHDRCINKPTQRCTARTNKDLHFIGHMKHTHEIFNSYFAIWIADPPFQLPTSIISLGRVTCTSNAIKLPSCPWNVIPQVKLQCNWSWSMILIVLCSEPSEAQLTHHLDKRYLQCPDKYTCNLFLTCPWHFQDAQTQHQAICR